MNIGRMGIIWLGTTVFSMAACIPAAEERAGGDSLVAAEGGQNDMNTGDDAGDDFATASKLGTMNGVGLLTSEDSWDCYKFPLKTGQRMEATTFGLYGSNISSWYFSWSGRYASGNSLKSVGCGIGASDSFQCMNGTACEAKLCLYPGNPDDAVIPAGTGDYSLNMRIIPAFVPTTSS